MARFGRSKASDSEIDELFGLAPAEQAGPAKPAKAGRKASSGDDLDDIWDQVLTTSGSGGLGQIDVAEDIEPAAVDPDDGDEIDPDLDDEAFSDELARDVFGVREENISARVGSLLRGGGDVDTPVDQGVPSRFDDSALQAAAMAAAKARAEEASVESVDLQGMSKEERKLYIEALGESLELYDHLVAIKPKERYVFRSDYFEIDGEGACACVLGIFHQDTANDAFQVFWGVNRIPRDLPEGSSAVLIETVQRRDDKWIEDALKKADKLDNMEQREQAEGGSATTKRKAAKAADDLYSSVAELQDGASYLLVHNRILLHAPDLDTLELVIDKLARQYIEDFSGSVTAAPYPGEQRQDFSALFARAEDKRGNGFGFTSEEFAGSYSLVTNGLTDPAGEYVGQMGGDYNNSAILFEVDRWKHHVVVADSKINEVLGRVYVSDMWGSKISQAALLNNHRVVHLVLNGAQLDKLGPKLESMTAVLDMTRGDVNMFEMFGERKDQLSIYGVHLTKLVLMAEQALGTADPAAISIIRSELKELLTQFYVDQHMWSRAAEQNEDELRLVGLDHQQVPLLKHFVPYLDTMYKKLLTQGNQDIKAQEAVKTLQGVFRDMLQANSDLFNQPTSDEIDSAAGAKRVIYDFSGLVHRGRGIAMAQLVNVVGFAVSSLNEGDVLLIHGADQIVDQQVQDYLHGQFDRMFRNGARVAYLYDDPDKMLSNNEFNHFERANYTVLGPMAKETVAEYERKMMTAVPDELKKLLTATDLMISYLRRGATNVVFSTQLSLGLRKLRAAGAGPGGEVVADRIKEVNRQERIARESQVAALKAEEAELAAERAKALTERPETGPDRYGPVAPKSGVPVGRVGGGRSRTSAGRGR